MNKAPNKTSLAPVTYRPLPEMKQTLFLKAQTKIILFFFSRLTILDCTGDTSPGAVSTSFPSYKQTQVLSHVQAKR